MIETGNCHICGHVIFNGIPNGRDINEFIKEKEAEGYRLGYFRQIKKVKPILKKVYVCPIYTGFRECKHQADNKEDMIRHICDCHTGHDLERFVRGLEEAHR